MNNYKIREPLSREEAEKILKDRKLDIEKRGENLSVYNKDKSITTLKNSNISYDNKKKYIPPKETESIECILS